MVYTVFVSLVIKNTSDLRELIENLARDVIFVSCLASTLWALQKTRIVGAVLKHQGGTPMRSALRARLLEAAHAVHARVGDAARGSQGGRAG